MESEVLKDHGMGRTQIMVGELGGVSTAVGAIRGDFAPCEGLRVCMGSRLSVLLDGSR